jgi:protein-tyrosine phosphatase
MPSWTVMSLLRPRSIFGKLLSSNRDPSPMAQEPEVRILFVCMGNICRSPTAESVFRHLVADSGLADRIDTDSAGTHAYHSNEPPDRRAQAAATRRGYKLDDIRARPVKTDDYSQFDYVIAMDSDNLSFLTDQSEEEFHSKLRLFMEFSSLPESDVPDPYYGGSAGFERVLDFVEDASRGLLDTITNRIGGKSSSN